MALSPTGTTRSPWPERPDTDQRCVGYLWVPADAVFLPAVEEVVRGALLVAGRPVHPLPALIAMVGHLVGALLPVAEPDRSWLLELETDEDDVYVRVWMRLHAEQDPTVDAQLLADLERWSGSFALEREGTGFLAVLQIELAD